MKLSVWLPVVLIIAFILDGCNGSNNSLNNNNLNPQSLWASSDVTFDQLGTIPVFESKPTRTLVYVHNNSDHEINGINYSGFDNLNGKYGADNARQQQIILQNSAQKCSSIKANSSCALEIVTPILSKDTTSKASAILMLSYLENNQTYHDSQIVNMSLVHANTPDGVTFASNISTPLTPSNTYSVVYAYASGVNQNYKIISLAIGSPASITINSLLNNQLVTSESVYAVEISIPESSKSYTIPLTITSQKQLTQINSIDKNTITNQIYTNSSNIEVTDATGNSIILSSNPTTTNLTTESNNGFYFLKNIGTRDVTLTSITTSNSSLSIETALNLGLPACNADQTLTAGNVCALGYRILSGNNDANSWNGDIKVHYSSAPANTPGVASSTIYWYKNSITKTPNITITTANSWRTILGSAYVITATISDGRSTITPVINNLNGASILPASCDLDSASFETSSCTFIVTPYANSGNYAYWDSANIANSTDPAIPSIYAQSGISLNISATNNATINGNTGTYMTSGITGIVVAPYIYLPAPMEGGSGTDNNGISWGTNGVVANRFKSGNQQTGIQCPIGQEIESDTLTGLTWVKNPNLFGKKNWQAALEAVNAMNGSENSVIGYHFCGYNDWRLPTIQELLSLMNYGVKDQAAWFNSVGFSNVLPAPYWSSTISQNNSEAWLISFYDNPNQGYFAGTVSTIIQNIPHYVWPVRGGQ